MISLQARIIMVAFSHYPADPRVRREAEALSDSGIPIDVLSLREPFEKKREVVNGVQVFRLPFNRKQGGKFRYFWEYGRFLLAAFCCVSTMFLRKRYRVVHVHSMPDILVFSAILPRLCGAKVILDIHDPMPEVFMAKYVGKETYWAIRLLRLFQKWSIQFADYVLTVNIALRDLLVSQGCPFSKIQIIVNAPQEEIFTSRKSATKKRPATQKGTFRLIYHGLISERNGLGVALQAIETIRKEIPNLLLEVYGDGDFVPQFINLVTALELENMVHYHGRVPIEEIVPAIQSVDLGLIPNVASLHWECVTPTRLFEYVCLGVPVICPRTKGILDYFDKSSLYFFETGKSESLANTILSAYHDRDRFLEKRERALALFNPHRWEVQRQHLIATVRKLLRN